MWNLFRFTFYASTIWLGEAIQINRPSAGFVPSAIPRSDFQKNQNFRRHYASSAAVFPQTIQHPSPSSVRLHATHEVGGGMKKPRVVCTGVGVVSKVGTGIDDFWKNLISGRSYTDVIKSFDVTDMTCQIGVEIPEDEFDAKQWFKDPKEVKRNDRYTHFAIAATKLALADAGLDPKMIEGGRCGVLVGSGIGGISWIEKEMKIMLAKGPLRVSPFLIPAMISNTAAGLIAIENGCQGPNHGSVSACATGTHAIGEAFRYIQNGAADVMICGGAEAAITPLSYAGFNSLRAMAVGFNDKPQKASRPFDKHRTGFVMGEGAGVIILESEEHAIKRGAKLIYGEMAGYAANCDAHHITAPSPGGIGLANCLDLLMKDANSSPYEVGYVNAHGTSTPYNDKGETQAIKRSFGDARAREILISSTKSVTGHCLGAAGGIEACVTAKALKEQVAPPTINYETPDPECDLNYCTNKCVKEKPFEAAISDTLGFGGHNAALLFRRYNPS